jgi:hypothetical protein
MNLSNCGARQRLIRLCLAMHALLCPGVTSQRLLCQWSTGASTMRPSSTQTPPPASDSAWHRRCAWATAAGRGRRRRAGAAPGPGECTACRQSPCAWRAPRPMPVVRGCACPRSRRPRPRQCRRGARPGPGPCAWAAALPRPARRPCLHRPEVQVAEGQPRTTWGAAARAAAASSPATLDQGQQGRLCPAARATACRVWARSALETTTPATPISTSCASARRSRHARVCLRR